MTDKCSYCGAELPVNAGKETKCLICGETPPSQTDGEVDPAFNQPPIKTPGSPDFSAPPKAEPAPDDSHAAPPPPPPPPSGPEPPACPTEYTPAWELDGGFWLAKLWKTIWQVLLHPVLTFSAPGRIQIGRPLVFALIVALAGNLVSDLFALLIIDEDVLGVAVLAKLPGSPFGSAIGTVLGLFIYGVSGVPVLMALLGSPFGSAIGTVLGRFIFGGLFHLFLLMFKAAKGGYVTTFRVLSYAGSIQIFIVAVTLPILLELWWLLAVAGSVFMVWQVVVMVCGLAAAHGATHGRVIGAMLLWFAAILLILYYLPILMMFLAIMTGNFAP